MCTLSQPTCEELKVGGMFAATTLAGTTACGALTTVTTAAGATYGALLVGSFIVSMKLIQSYSEGTDAKTRLVVSFILATVVAALLTPLFVGQTITLGSALLLDIAGIVSMLVLTRLIDWVCGNPSEW